MKLNWYFDFISPFAYLQLGHFDRLPDKVEVTYKPILFAGLLNHWQNIGPAEIPPKRVFTYKHCYWYAKKHGIEFKMPPAHPFNSLSGLRLAIACHCDPKAVQTIFDVIWKHGMDLHSKQAIDYLESELGIKNVNELISLQSVKDQLKANTEQAASRNVFGVPTFSIKNLENQYENFWGLDTFEMMLDYIASPDSFNDQQMKQIERLPEGVQRKRV
jgi:2-hydroxychromene-2-carboxylate isomerase